jgi:hypothetical protein
MVTCMEMKTLNKSGRPFTTLSRWAASIDLYNEVFDEATDATICSWTNFNRHSRGICRRFQSRSRVGSSWNFWSPRISLKCNITAWCYFWLPEFPDTSMRSPCSSAARRYLWIQKKCHINKFMDSGFWRRHHQ